MSARTTIEWTRGDDGSPGATWNPVTGCTEVGSPGCDHCYAKTFAERFRGTPNHYYTRGFDVQLRPEKLDQPMRWRRPRRIFVNSMSDQFHDSVPDDYIAKVWARMALAPRHTFQVLTKRHARMRSLLSDHEFGSYLDHEIDGLGGNHSAAGYDWPLRNVWVGVSAENQQWADIRIPALLDTPAAVRFVSAEPLLGPIDLTGWLPCPTPNDCGPGACSSCAHPDNSRFDNRRTWSVNPIDWVIVGGESGRGARPMHPVWARSIRDQCRTAGVAFLYKQWGEWTAQRDEPVHRGPHSYVHVATGEVANTPAALAGGDWAPVYRLGKSRSGRLLDGQIWDEYPAAYGAEQLTTAGGRR